MIVKTINYYKIKKQELLGNHGNVLEFSERDIFYLFRPALDS